MNFVLTIAGSDSSAGAGIQADIKTFFKLRVKGLSVLTGITAQNSRGVFSIYPVPPEEIEKQLKALEEDFNIVGAKVGMVPNRKTVEVIHRFFKRRRDIFFLLDPVLISTSGYNLFLENTKEALKEKLIPLCNLITPNLDEAMALLGEKEKDNFKLAEKFYEKFKVPLLLKGGHKKGKEIEDIFFDGKKMKVFKGKRIKGEFHGTGCILSSAILSYISKGYELIEAIKRGRAFLYNLLLKNSFSVSKKMKYIIF
ncbi:MAG: bifunctional hydroxymethylpyrimidine kinase/phosphomethylpyrimidine kinase [Thermoanaerobaculia bacterium]